MKRTMFLVALTLAFAAASAQNLTVGSYNIRNVHTGDARKGDGWAQGRPGTCELVQWAAYPSVIYL